MAGVHWDSSWQIGSLGHPWAGKAHGSHIQEIFEKPKDFSQYVSLIYFSWVLLIRIFCLEMLR